MKNDKNDIIKGDKLQSMEHLLASSLINLVKNDKSAQELWHEKDVFNYPKFEGKRGFWSTPHIYLVIGTQQTKKTVLNDRIKLLRHFGECSLVRSDGGATIYAKMNSLSLDSLKPDISANEIRDGQKILSDIVKHLKKAEEIFKKKIPLAESQELANNLKTYLKEVKETTKMGSLDRVISNCGSAVDSLDTYTSLLLNSWAKSGSREALLYAYGMPVFSDIVAQYGALSDSLKNGQTRKSPSLGNDAVNSSLILLSKMGFIGSALTLLDQPRPNLISNDDRTECISEIRKADELIESNKGVLLKIVQLHLYNEAVRSLARSR